MATDQPNPRGDQVVTIAIAMIILSGSFVLARLATRLGIVRRCGSDDYLIIFALLLSIGLTITIKAEQEHGLGLHVSTLAPGEVSGMLKPFLASAVFYNAGLAVTKCSILCQFLRFFVERTPRRWCWFGIAFNTALGITACFGTIFACIPVSYYWNQVPGRGHCFNIAGFLYSTAALNILSDIAICVLPIPVIQSLQLPRRQRYGLMIVFTLGGFVCVTSILRLHSLYVLSHDTDVTWDVVGAAVWSCVEFNTAIVCACIPTLKPILHRVFPRALSSSRAHDTNELRGDNYIRHSAGIDQSRHSKTAAALDVTKSMNSITQSRAYEVEDEWNEEQTLDGPNRAPQNYTWTISAMDKRKPERKPAGSDASEIELTA